MIYLVVLVFESGHVEQCKMKATSKTDAVKRVLAGMDTSGSGLMSVTVVYSGD